MPKDTFILGFSDSLHDRSVSLFRNAEPIVTIEEERLTRVKHGLPLYGESRKNPSIFSQMALEKSDSATNENCLNASIRYCLDAAGITMDDIDIVIGNSLHTSLPFHDRALYINHHLAHASSAFYASGFEDAAILVSDGYGDPVAEQNYETVMLAHGNGNDIRVLKTVSGSVSNYYDMQQSIGVFYRIGTLLAGFGMFDEGKAMGLSAWGKPVYYDRISKFVEYGEDMIIINNGPLWDALSREIQEREIFEVRANIAASFQKHLEEMMMFYVDYLYKQTKSENLCIAGGVGLNCVSNAKICAASKFKNVFVFPATGDNGISMGSAYYAAHHVLRLPRTSQLQHAYFGRTYNHQEEKAAIDACKDRITYAELADEEKIAHAVKLLSENKIIMWYQEGCETGPRALGHRSIIANPQTAAMRDNINENVKFRETFRPLAPIVTEEHVSQYFEFQQPSPFMLFSPRVKEITKKKAPAIVHTDGTSRLQTINATQNPILHALITRFGEETGTPIILNTSFNGKDEPIVETPEQALRTFLHSPVEYLFMDSFFISKL